MRFFKYLVFIILISLSTSSFAITCSQLPEVANPDQYCKSKYGSSSYSYRNGSTTDGCPIRVCTGGTEQFTDPRPKPCPQKGYPADFHQGANGEIPTRRCLNINGNICSFSAQGKEPFWVTLSGGSTPTRQLYSDSEQASPSCTNLNEGQCDTKNPYGSCYIPPNDNCIRNKDGSINCPSNNPPPIQQGCENGAIYCDRPPNGCGPNYVSGSFNGRQICVKKGPEPDPNKPVIPNDPTKPNDPNTCSTSYCPKPDPNQDCPVGYYQTSFEGKSICVKNNPTPNQSNPNDPNNSNEPPLPNNPDSFDPSGIINAIKSLKDSLLSAIGTVSKKLTDVTNLQTQTNQKLDKSNQTLEKINDSTTAASEALGTTNKHLDKIEEATQAASTGIGETNKKLDQIFSDQGKEQIEQLGEQSTDSRLTSAESEMTSKLQSFANTLSYSSSHACISDLTVTNIPHFGSMTVPLSNYCDLLALVKLLLKLAVLMLALKMIDATVRTF